MIAALQQGKQALRKVEAPAERPVVIGSELSEDEQQRIRAQFFAAGVEQWLHVVEDCTFPTVSLPLSKAACQALQTYGAHAGKHSSYIQQLIAENDCVKELAQTLEHTLRERGWDRAFVKLSVRSPKDAPAILAAAGKAFMEADGLSVADPNERTALLASLVQERFCISSGAEAVALLLASPRVGEDLQYALEAPRYEELSMHVVLRKWEQAIPISREFRGIVWEGEMNALGQYYHSLYFPELAAIRSQVETDVRAVFDRIKPRLLNAGFAHCIVDFAWTGPGEVTVIEVNPFDGVALGCFPGSTGLFHWHEPDDEAVIRRGPFEMRIRTETLPEAEIRCKMNTSWRDIAFPPRS